MGIDIYGARSNSYKNFKGLSFRELGKLIGRDPDQLASWLSYYKKPCPRNLDHINRFLAKYGLHLTSFIRNKRDSALLSS